MTGAGSTARARTSDSPWLGREDWASRRIRSHETASMVVAWLFALGFTGFSIPLAGHVWRDGAAAPGAAAVGLLFAAAALGMCAWAGVATARWLRFRRVVLELATLPGVLGGKLAGAVHLGTLLPGPMPFTVTLSCVRIRRRGKNRSEDLLWQHEEPIPATAAGRGVSGTRVPFSFAVPFELPESQLAMQGGEQIEWRVDVRASLAGADLASRFVVPVFRTAESSPDVTERVGPDTAPGRQPALAMGAGEAPLPDDPRVLLRALAGGGIEVFYPAGRNKAGAAALTAFAALWTGFVLFAWSASEGPMAFFLVPFLAVALLLWAFVPAAWLQRTTVRARAGTLEIQRGTFTAGRTRRIDAAAIESIGPEAAGSNAGRARWRVRVHLANGRRVGAGSDLRSKESAQRIAAALWSSAKR